MTTLATPLISDENISEYLDKYYGLKGELKALPSYIDLNRELIDIDGKRWVVKIANVNQNREELDFENQVIDRLSSAEQVTIAIPELKRGVDKVSQMHSVFDEQHRPCWMRVISFLPGSLWAETDTQDERYAESLGAMLGNIDKVLATFEHPMSERFLIWDIRHSSSIIQKHLSAINDTKGKSIIEAVLADYRAQVIPRLAELPIQIVHNDANDYNLLVDPEAQKVCGLFDFGDMVKTYRIAELAIAAAYAMMNKAEPASIILSMARAYHEVNPLTETEMDLLINFIRARLAVSLCLSSHQYQLQPENEYLLISQKGAWDALQHLASLDPIQFSLKLKSLCHLPGADQYSNEAIIRYRKTHLSENLSLAYQHPLKIVAGRGAYLYSETGDRYIDMVNNVCHVGHCHPKVVAAGQKQMAILNTNTRYLHQNIVQFSEKLLATLPAELSVCMFVNSGSEANELALRLARKYTGRRSMLVVEGAYHGNANACIDISPYKFDGPGGEGSPSWVKQTLVPDPFRGKYRGRTTEVGIKYADDVKRLVEEFSQQGQPVCGFICESIQGVGGQVFHPPGYLKHAYQHVRAAGGVCIADEVQVGMGRVGSHWWAFQAQEVVPDIMTIGKPLGNGHPLAAVVTTKAIADAFVSGMEYFNTFGGNPVSCAIGSAVLDVVREEKLQQHAVEVGNYLMQGLNALQRDFPIIGDVRGSGMFIGAEFIKDAETLEPAVEQIDYVIERLKDEGILLTTEGPYHNVFKIKPPLAFSIADADYFLQKLDVILREEKAQVRI